MDYSAFKEAVIARCQAKGITEYELYYERAESTSVKIYRREVDQFTASVDGGVCFRCIVDGHLGYASTEHLSIEQASAIVDKAADNAACLETNDPVFLGAGGQTYTPLNRELYPLPTTEELIAAALSTQQALYDAHPAVIDGSATQGISEYGEIAICNSNGLDLSYVNHISGLVVTAMVAEGEEKVNNAEIKLGKLAAIDQAQLAQKAVEGAMKKLGGEVPPTRSCPVVFNPEAMADLLQTFCGIFSSEAAQKGLSRFAQAEGTVIASPAVTVVDDPFHPESPSPMPFDAEGTPTRRKNVVENGVLQTLLYNLKTANLAGKTSTGNAAKGGYNSPVGIRPFTMYLAPGTVTEAQLLEQAGEGVYIDFITGLHAGANPISGDFSLQSAGYLIEKGQKTTHVKSFTVAGNFYDLLKNITAVADNLELPAPLGITTFGSPSVLVASASIAGK